MTKEEILSNEFKGETNGNESLRAMDVYAEKIAIEFEDWIADARNDEGTQYINRNPFGIKPGYYTTEELYKLFLKSKVPQTS
jgi:asparagine synthetase B (glutamine-hydrolysing)